MPGLWSTARAVALFLPLASPCMAEGDPCGPPSPAIEGERWQAGIDREIAVYIAKHLQRACRRLSAYPSIELDDTRAKDARARSDDLRNRLASLLLAPIYDRFPTLRDKDLTEEAVPAIEGEPSDVHRHGNLPHGLTIKPDAIDRESAVSLLRAVKAARDRAFTLAIELGEGSSSRERTEAMINALFGIAAEIGFAENPAYAAFPDLWRELMRRPRDDEARTEERDANFRRSAISARALHFTRPARVQMRRYLAALRAQTGRDQVIAVSWSLGGQMMGPNDREAKTLPAAISIGAFDASSLPSDVIGRIGHVPVFVSESKPDELAGKTVDYRSGRFKLVDR